MSNDKVDATFHGQHLYVERDDVRVEVIDRDKDTATCKVWYRGEVIFDGVSRAALMQKATPAQGERSEEDLAHRAAIGQSYAREIEDQDWDDAHKSLRPSQVVEMWTSPLMSRGHRIVEARYVGTGMEGKTACGRQIVIPSPGYLHARSPERACATCSRIVEH